MDFDVISKIGISLITFGGFAFGVAKWFAHSDIAKDKIERIEKSLGNQNMITRDVEIHNRSIEVLEKDMVAVQKEQSGHLHRISDLEKKVTAAFELLNKKADK